MPKTFRYRLLTAKAQETAMTRILSECRCLDNALLEAGKTMGLYAQHAALPAMKKERPSRKGVHSPVLQNVAVRLDLEKGLKRVQHKVTPHGHPAHQRVFGVVPNPGRRRKPLPKYIGAVSISRD